jgi:hypothetical protein
MKKIVITGILLSLKTQYEHKNNPRGSGNHTYKENGKMKTIVKS